MTWAGLPAGPGGPLAAARAVREGPPRAYEVDGATYELRPSWWPMLELIPAGAWRLPFLLDMTHPEDAVVLRARILDRGDPFGMAEVEAVAGALVEHATGRPWWVVERLYHWTLGHFAEIDGRTHHDLVDLVELNPARCCNVVHMALVEGCDDKTRTKFDEQLYMPPPKAREVKAPPAWMAEDEGSGFMAAMAQAGGMKALPGAAPGGKA